jgi:RHS repeat-associated protein
VTDPNPFQFTGRENDGTGLMYYRHRYYAPQWGRFISEDPLGFAAGINQYAYCHNNPVNATDPTGQASSPRPGVPPDFRPPTQEEWVGMDTWRVGGVGVRGDDARIGTDIPSSGPITETVVPWPNGRVEFNPDGTFKPPVFPYSDINPGTGHPYYVEPTDVAPKSP